MDDDDDDDDDGGGGGGGDDDDDDDARSVGTFARAHKKGVGYSIIANATKKGEKMAKEHQNMFPTLFSVRRTLMETMRSCLLKVAAVEVFSAASAEAARTVTVLERESDTAPPGDALLRSEEEEEEPEPETDAGDARALIALEAPREA